MKKAELNETWIESWFEDLLCEYGRKTMKKCKVIFNKLKNDDEFKPLVIINEAIKDDPPWLFRDGTEQILNKV